MRVSAPSEAANRVLFRKSGVIVLADPAVSAAEQSTMTLYVGYLASALVLCTFLTRTMKPLRCIALGSNVAFITYSVMLQLYPVLILHCILLPVNVWRLWEIMRLGKSVDKAINDSKLFNAVVPFAKKISSVGEIRKGDPSDALYLSGHTVGRGSGSRVGTGEYR